MSASRPAQTFEPPAVEPLTEEQAEAVRRWEASGKADSPQVAALRKKLRGEPLTAAELALLSGLGRKPDRPGTPHSEIEAELAERTRRGV